MDIEEIAYIARDNTIELSLLSNGEPIVHTGILRCQIAIGNLLLDSATLNDAFDLSNADRIILRLGDTAVVAGDYTAKLYVFDLNSIEGLYWGSFSLTVTT